MNSYEFKDGGARFCIYTPNTPSAWFNYLFNDEYIFKCSQRLCGDSFSVSDFKQKPVLKSEKQFFVKLGENIFRLCAGMGNSYICSHYMHKTVVSEEFECFKSKITVFVPCEGKRELWKIEISDISEKFDSVDVFAEFPFQNIDYQGLQCYFDRERNCFIKNCFPYYIKYDEYDAAASNRQFTYASSNIKCTSYECNLQRYFGYDNPYIVPQMVESGMGSNTDSDFEQSAAAFHHHFDNKRNIEIQYLIQDIKSEDEKFSIVFPDFDDELKKSREKWERIAKTFTASRGSDLLRNMTDYWLKKQVIYLATHNRGGVYCPVRNQLQDLLGYSMIDANDAFERMIPIIERQEKSGFIKQWYMTDGSPDTGLCRISHSDAPIWLIICVCEIIMQTGNLQLFEKRVLYKDGKNDGSIKEHLLKAAKYMSKECGAHGLCLMKDGDWTDPINGAGYAGRGESVWNTLALIYAIKKMKKIFDSRFLDEQVKKLTDSVNKYAWDIDRYIVGFDDGGKPFGKNGDKEGALFINTQTWAVMAEVCDKEKLNTIRNTIEKLRTDYGYRLLTPAFSSYNAQWGKISIKQKGATENGSVYSHATAFKAYADCVSGDYDAAIKTLEDLMPKEDAIQAPLYLPNYYFGLDGDNFGRSSCVFSSGAPAWVLWIMKKYFAEG